MIDLDALAKAAARVTPFSQSAARLTALAARDDWAEREVVDIVEQDQGLALRVLRQANCAVYVGKREVTTLREAVSRLGMGAVLSAAVGAAVRGSLTTALPAYELGPGALWRHSIAAAAVVTAAQSCGLTVPAEAHVSALPHDVGKIVMADFLSPDVLAVLEQARTDGALEGVQAECEALEVHHGEIGGLVAQRWKLPASIVHGITHHHTPELEPSPTSDLVAVAESLAHTIDGPRVEGAPFMARPPAGAARRLGLDEGGLFRLCDAAHDRLASLLEAYG